MSINHETDQIIKSPCIRQCCLDSEDVCVGCYRTINEILMWQAATNEQKVEMLGNASRRKNKLSDCP
ncbi:DUF1289 domain-containing protein [Marinomonas shanghaiensis]|jgi:uncharacterized protein|uniref:DUF1289 domain-containing protein n=1 Tax=Marinomonas shanghaiensis TaxID=2202418 RepID=UPI000DB95317|nr:DUF1289 domain-containing protein [Marinomonas shanghaiensis]